MKTKALRDVYRINKRLDLGLTVSPDEKYLIFAQRDYETQDLMLVDNFQ